MSSIVIYTSTYGSTEKYAHWIAQSLKCEAKKLSEIQPKDLANFHTIVYGGGLYAGSISGFKKFLAKLGDANNKRLVLYMVGMTDPERKETYAAIAEKSIPPEWKSKFQVFAFRGDQLFSRMSFLHRLMMKMPKSLAEKKPMEERTKDDEFFLETFGKDVVFTNKEAIQPLIDYVNGVE